MKTILFKISFLILSYLLFGCESTITQQRSIHVEKILSSAGVNKTELQKVIDHYKKKKEPQKLQAAFFLIENMKGKSFIDPENNAYRIFFDQLTSLREKDVIISPYALDSIWAIHESEQRFKEIKDASVVSSAQLIENIDEAFLAWEAAPWKENFSFDTFCEYVLPYRNIYDTPQLWRAEFHKKYDSAVTSSKNILETVASINSAVEDFGYWPKMADVPNMSIHDADHLHYGTCRQHSNLKIGILRSLGIPCVQVTAMIGTEWVAVINEKGNFVDYGSHYAPQNENPYYKKRYRWWPKVMIHSYQNLDNPFERFPNESIPSEFLNTNLYDATRHFTPSQDVNIRLTEPAPISTRLVYLKVLYDNNWIIVDWAEAINGKASFDQLGCGNIYFPFYYINDRHYPASAPFYLKLDGTRSTFIPDMDNKYDVKLTRKNPLDIPEVKYSQLMVGVQFEGSNQPDFSESEILGQIETAPSYMETTYFHSEKKFRYVRLKTDTLIGCAEIEFSDHRGNRLNGSVINSDNIDDENAANAFDMDIRTNCNNDKNLIWGAHDKKISTEQFSNKTITWMGLDLKTPQQIGSVGYLFQNCFNTIEIGNEYELFYWNDQKWNSLGIVVAQKDIVEYNVPENALLLLRNHTQGTQELPFFMKNGAQVFGGWYH